MVSFGLSTAKKINKSDTNDMTKPDAVDKMSISESSSADSDTFFTM